MIILASIFFVIVIFGLFFLFRWSGRMERRPGPAERMSHSAHENHGHGPRATGVN